MLVKGGTERRCDFLNELQFSIDAMSIVWNTLLAKKVVTPRDDVSFFVIISISSVREV